MFEIRAAPDDSNFDPEKEAAPEQMHFNRAVTYLSQMAGAGGIDKVSSTLTPDSLKIEASPLNLTPQTLNPKPLTLVPKP